MTHYAIDFGTTNTVIASDADGVVRPVALKSVMGQRLDTPVVPTAVYFRKHGREFIGQPAVEMNLNGRDPNFTQGFKRWFLSQDDGPGADPLRATRRYLDQAARRVATVDGDARSAKDAAEAFFDGLRAALGAQFRPRRSGLLGMWDDLQDRRRPLLSDLTLTVPVEALKWTRDSLYDLGRRAGGRTIRIVDEPVAAAIGYGVNLRHEQTLLVFDWGGGTLDICAVHTGPDALRTGRAEVLAKSGVALGGDDVDAWIVAKFLFPVEQFVEWWEVDAKLQACQAKESAGTVGRGIFQFRSRPAHTLTRDDLSALLAEHGAYAAMERALGEVLERLAAVRRARSDVGEIDHVLLVGGSSLLPGVDERLRKLLPQARVAEWKPFEAVAVGACEFARGGHVRDQIYHDYALRVADGSGLYYEQVVPEGTLYPAEMPEREYFPDPASPRELLFEFCEIRRLGLPRWAWAIDAAGLYTCRPADPAEHARALILATVHLQLPPSRRTQRRLRVTYRVDAERSLRWTVRDGETHLRDDEALGRLR